jgi:hypothetical protein
MLYVQSFCVTQNEIVKAYEKAIGVQWDVRTLDAEKFKNEEKTKADAGDLDAIEGELPNHAIAALYDVY